MVEQNGNGNGNGKLGNFWSGVINIAASGILLAALWMFWQVANPNPRLDKIDVNLADLRKELITNYLSLREHQEFQTRNDRALAAIDKRLEDFRTYAVNFYEKFENLPNSYPTRNEAQKVLDLTQARIDRLYGLLDDLSRRVSSVREKDQARLPVK